MKVIPSRAHIRSRPGTRDRRARARTSLRATGAPASVCRPGRSIATDVAGHAPAIAWRAVCRGLAADIRAVGKSNAAAASTAASRAYGTGSAGITRRAHDKARCRARRAAAAWIGRLVAGNVQEIHDTADSPELVGDLLRWGSAAAVVTAAAKGPKKHCKHEVSRHFSDLPSTGLRIAFALDVGRTRQIHTAMARADACVGSVAPTFGDLFFVTSIGLRRSLPGLQTARAPAGSQAYPGLRPAPRAYRRGCA